MKKTLLIKGALAVAAATFIGTSAHAQVPVASGGNGDVVMEFNASSGTGHTYDYEIDLGNFANFLPGGSYATAIGGFTPLTLVSTTDLSSNSGGMGFGSLWGTDGLVSWSLAGQITTTGQALQVGTILGTNVGGDTTHGNGNQSSLDIASPYVQSLGNYTATGNSTEAAFLATSNGDDFDADNNGGAPFFGFTPFDEAYQQTGYGSLELYDWLPSSSKAPQQIGIITVNSSGAEFQSVPEPSTWVCIALGAAVLLGLRRRRLA